MSDRMLDATRRPPRPAARRTSLLCLWALVFALAVLPATAGDETEGPYDGAWTPAELQALDRALHAANLTRVDLTFKKDLTKGHACLPVVRAMLADPLRIPAVAAEYGDTSPTLAIRAFRGCWDDAGTTVLENPLPAVEGTAKALLAYLGSLVSLEDPSQTVLSGLGTDVDLQALRLLFPEQMAWHDVFASPFDEETTAGIEARMEGRDPAWLHEVATRLRVDDAYVAWLSRLHKLEDVWEKIPASGFPRDEPLIVETPEGRIALGTPGDDVYEGEFVALIEPGGNDRYVNCRLASADGALGRPVSLFVDLGGDDVYECADVNFTLGAAILGVAAFLDLGQGNDRYSGGHASLGAAMGGIATFYDDGGSDVYEGKTYTQGAAGFGIGIFHDASVQDAPDVPTDAETPDPIDLAAFDNDRLSAWANAQAFARCRGVALCINERGNEVYQAGGVYLHAPLFSDRYQSFSQGFAIGARNIDYAGGLAVLIDQDGNDRYLGDIYNQGVGYWYGAGLLYDGGGNDTYEMTQYGQGSGIHLAVGGLVDESGHDTYVMHSGLGQGSSHDYAVSVLHDRGGNDRYLGNTSCNGAALTNSVGIHVDRSGNDTYAGRRKGSINFGRPARGFDSIGVLLDLDGEDDYLGIMADDSLWRHTHIGVGWDTTPTPEPAEDAPGGVTPAADQPSGKAEIPEICAYEGELTAEVFDELWAIAVRWEVGDNRVIVPKARERLARFPPQALLPMMDAVLEESASGLELRAYVDVLKAFLADGHDAEVASFVATNLRSEIERRKRIALYLAGELGMDEMAGDIATLLAGEDVDLARRAAGVLAQLKSHAGDEALLAWLSDERDEQRLQAALGTLLGLESDVYADVRGLLGHPLLSVRTRLVQLLVDHASAYLDEVRADLWSGDHSDRMRRSLLEILVRTKTVPDVGEVLAVTVLAEHPDWGVRADAVRLLRIWEDDEGVDRELLAPGLAVLVRLRASETDPYVRFCLRDK